MSPLNREHRLNDIGFKIKTSKKKFTTIETEQKKHLIKFQLKCFFIYKEP